MDPCPGRVRLLTDLADRVESSAVDISCLKDHKTGIVELGHLFGYDPAKVVAWYEFGFFCAESYN